MGEEVRGLDEWLDKWFPVMCIVALIASGGMCLVLLVVASVERDPTLISFLVVETMGQFFIAGYFTKMMRARDEEEAKKSCL